MGATCIAGEKAAQRLPAAAPRSSPGRIGGAFSILCSLAHGQRWTEVENLALAITRRAPGLRKEMRSGMAEIRQGV
jgi:hypothetical protein